MSGINSFSDGVEQIRHQSYLPLIFIEIDGYLFNMTKYVCTTYILKKNKNKSSQEDFFSK